MGNEPRIVAEEEGKVVTKSLRSLSDQALLDACRLLPWEARVDRFLWSAWGCTVVPVATAWVALLCNLAMNNGTLRGWYWLLFAPLGFVAATMAFGWQMDLRKRPYRQELRRRYAGATIQTYIADIETEANPDEPTTDMVVLMAGAELPHGSTFLVRVLLRTDGTGDFETRRLRAGPVAADGADTVVFSANRCSLSPVESHRVRHLAEERFPLRRIRSTVTDGTPAEIAVWKRARGVMQACRCNLSDIPPALEDHAAVRLMRYLRALEIRAAQLEGRSR